MSVIKFMPADILRGKLLDAGWYGLSIKSATDWAKSKDGQSLNCIITFVVDNSEGKEIDYVINSKGLGFHVPLLAAVMGVKDLDPKEIELDTSTLAGKKVDGKVIVDEYNGNLNNKISTFLPAGMGKNQQVPY